MESRGVLISILCGVLLFTSGCADKKSRLLSTNIPLNMYDLEEIRSGADSHKELIKTQKLIDHAEINAYISDVGRKLASVSERPHMPWQFFLIDNDSTCEAYALPGGYIYLSSGLFRFIQSEAELAAVLAHEVGHTSAYRYQKREESKKVRFGRLAKMGAGAAGGAIGGPAGGAASSILSGIEMSSPYIKQQFSKNAEAEADGRAMQYLQHLGYPSGAVVSYNKRLASIPIDSLPVFIHFFNAHPPSDYRVQKAVENLEEISKSTDASVAPYTTDRHYEMVQELVKMKGESGKKSLIDKILSPPEDKPNETAGSVINIPNPAVLKN
ncbi:MAG: M48 family metalloprotease [Candidatus Omnitrophica bacterium]|nr:M48 family metalloprotease [Candidatus Omnitrophota bacterium]